VIMLQKSVVINMCCCAVCDDCGNDSENGLVVCVCNDVVNDMGYVLIIKFSTSFW
jgi:hypothetical protein